MVWRVSGVPSPSPAPTVLVVLLIIDNTICNVRTAGVVSKNAQGALFHSHQMEQRGLLTILPLRLMCLELL